MHLLAIADATELVRTDALMPNKACHSAAVRRWARQAGRIALCPSWCPVRFFSPQHYEITRPIRNAIGLRAPALRRSRGVV